MARTPATNGMIRTSVSRRHNAARPNATPDSTAGSALRSDSHQARKKIPLTTNSCTGTSESGSRETQTCAALVTSSAEAATAASAVKSRRTARKSATGERSASSGAAHGAAAGPPNTITAADPRRQQVQEVRLEPWIAGSDLDAAVEAVQPMRPVLLQHQERAPLFRRRRFQQPVVHGEAAAMRDERGEVPVDVLVGAVDERFDGPNQRGARGRQRQHPQQRRKAERRTRKTCPACPHTSRHHQRKREQQEPRPGEHAQLRQGQGRPRHRGHQREQCAEEVFGRVGRARTRAAGRTGRHQREHVDEARDAVTAVAGIFQDQCMGTATLSANPYRRSTP